MITVVALRKITRDDKTEFKKYVDHLNQTFAQFDISTNRRQCHFLAQVLHESGNLKYTRELGTNLYFSKYEGRIDLGNDTPGDGLKYKGRGFMQVTGKSNYMRVSRFFNQDFINSPTLLESPEWACKTAGWYWMNTRLNDYADGDDFLQVTYRINGGHNGIIDRFLKFTRALSVYGVDQGEIELVKARIRDRILMSLGVKVKPTNFDRSLQKAFPNPVDVGNYLK